MRLLAVCEFHASGFEGVDDVLAVSIGPSTTASPALTDKRPNCWRNWVLRRQPWEDGIADDVLESVAVDFVAMRAAGAV